VAKLREEVPRVGVAALQARLAQERVVVLVHEDAGPGGLQLGHDAGVVRVRVGQHHCGNVGALAPEGLKLVVQRPAEARDARVHGGEPAALLDEVPVHHLRADAVDAGHDLNRSLHRGVVSARHAAAIPSR
jgi:hypothetical protein